MKILLKQEDNAEVADMAKEMLVSIEDVNMWRKQLDNFTTARQLRAKKARARRKARKQKGTDFTRRPHN